ncbi:hypothetical protein JCM19235_1623 [Vibrio maritimus]|uniref:Uncharacterized protein n=1 Tax=Vibrio maritimus TaxID=990268 RepID=A0A090S2K9_9VIBR|nr:hypothetical protein JCM19235_1623 [Vibrio maritimus]
MIGLEATEINATLSSGLQAGLQNPVALPPNQDPNTEWIEEHQISLSGQPQNHWKHLYHL